MDLTFSAEERAFEQEVRDFIAQNLTPEMKRATALTPSVFSDPDIGMAWQRALHRKGWVAPGWPVEYGGPDWTAAQRWIFEAECARAGVPNVNIMGVKMVGPVIIGFGTPEQKNFYLPRILSRRGLLVPGLLRARLRLRSRLAEDARGARRRPLHRQRHQDLDHACAPREPHVRAGAHQRHAAPAGRHQLPAHRHEEQGITTRPILTIGGDHEVNQVFFDDVRVPVANRVGEEGKGWTYGKYLLEFERGSGIASAKLRDALKTVSDLAESDATGRAIDDPDIALADVGDRGRYRYARDDRVAGAVGAADRAEPGRGVVAAEAAGQRNPPGGDAARRRLIGNDGLAVEPMRPFYRLNEEPPVRRRCCRSSGVSQRPGLHDLRRLVGDPARHRRQDGAGL